MRNVALLSVLAMCCIGQAQTLPATHPVGRVIEDAGYRDDAAAQAAWTPMEGSPAVSMAQVEGRRAVKFPCNFSKKVQTWSDATGTRPYVST